MSSSRGWIRSTQSPQQQGDSQRRASCCALRHRVARQRGLGEVESKAALARCSEMPPGRSVDKIEVTSFSVAGCRRRRRRGGSLRGGGRKSEGDFHRLRSLWLVRRSWRAESAHRLPGRQHQTRCRVCPMPKTLLSNPPPISFHPLLASFIIFILAPNRPPLAPQHTPSSLRWPRILLHALPRPTARRAPLAPNLPHARSTHGETPQRPIAHANRYTRRRIPRDVPAISSDAIIACERSNGPAAAAQLLPSREIARFALLAASKEPALSIVFVGRYLNACRRGQRTCLVACCHAPHPARPPLPVDLSTQEHCHPIHRLSIPKE